MILPVGPRDVEMVDLVLAGIEENVVGASGRLWLVAPEGVARVLGRRYPRTNVVEDHDLCPADIRRRLRKEFASRESWLTQQLITLSSPEITAADAALVVDADTVLIRPRCFRSGDRTMLLAAREFHIGYHEAAARLWRERLALPAFSCIAHHMCFLRADLLAMRHSVEDVSGKHWMQALVDCCEEGGAFSEYELYGQWRLKVARTATVVRPFRNVARARVSGLTFRELRRTAPARAYSVSCHWYL